MKKLQDMLQNEGECLSIISSNGAMVVLSVKALHDGAPEDSEDENDSNSVSFAVLAMAALEAEPRLTAVSAWNPHVYMLSKKEAAKKEAAKNVTTADSDEEL